MNELLLTPDGVLENLRKAKGLTIGDLCKGSHIATDTYGKVKKNMMWN